MTIDNLKNQNSLLNEKCTKQEEMINDLNTQLDAANNKIAELMNTKPESEE